MPGRAAIVFIVTALVTGAASHRAAADDSPTVARYEFSEVHMGTDFRVVLYAANKPIANRAAAAAFARIAELNKVLSDYDPESELSLLSVTAATGRRTKLSNDLWTVLARSQQLAEATDGAFDVTVGPLTKMWRSARRSKAFPPGERMAEARAAVGYRHLRLDATSRTAELTQPNMRLDLGGIGMGYAADEALRIITQHGITSAMIDASGDVVCSAAPPGERGWKIGIAPLTESAGPPSRYVWLAHRALTTSGDAFQFVEIGGRRYSHIVDPQTGLGLATRSSVTVIAPDCTTADSMATAVSVLGPQRGMKFVESIPDVAALIVISDDDGVRTCESATFPKSLDDGSDSAR